MQRLMVMAGLVLAIFAAPMAASAQTAGRQGPAASASERMQLARRFVQLLQGQQMGTMIAQMAGGMSPERGRMSTEEQARFDHAIELGTTQMMDRLFDEMTPIYADIFTVEELRGLVGFYESDIGKSMMRKSRDAGPKMMLAINRIMPELITEMGNTICDDLGCTAKEREEMLAAMAEEIQ